MWGRLASQKKHPFVVPMTDVRAALCLATRGQLSVPSGSGLSPPPTFLSNIRAAIFKRFSASGSPSRTRLFLPQDARKPLLPAGR
jgi:hypothetical protein